jgi:vitamin B12 transporter
MKKFVYAAVAAMIAAGVIFAFSPAYSPAAVLSNSQQAQQYSNGMPKQIAAQQAQIKAQQAQAQQAAQASQTAKVGDVVVTAERMAEDIALVARNIDIIESGEITDAGFQNITDVLDTVGGLTIQQNGGYEGLSDVLTRGAPSNETLVMIDNIPINDLLTGGADLTIIDISMIQQVEIIEGGMSAIYGADAPAGVINIITGSKELKPFSAEADYGSFDYQKYVIGSDYKIMGITYDAAAVEERSGGYTANSDFMKRTANLKLQFKGDLLDSTLTGNYFKRDMGLIYDLFSRQSDEDYNLGIDEKFNIGAIKAKVSGYMRSQDLSVRDSDPDTENSYSSREIKKEYESNEMFSYDIGGNISFMTGYETDSKDVKAPEMAGDKSFTNQASMSSVTAKFLNDSLLINGGFRADFNSSFGNMTSENISAKYNIPENVELRGLFDKSFSVPTLGDLYWSQIAWYSDYKGALPSYHYMAGNPNLTPENSTNYELSISKKDSNIKESLAFFKNDIDNLIDWTYTPDGVTSTPVNINKAAIIGAEAKVEMALGDNIALKANYTYLNAVDANTKQPLAYRPANNANVTVAISLPFKTRINITGRYFDVRYNGYNSELKSYYLLNTSISQEFSKNIKLHFNVDNVLDNTAYQVVQYYVMPGRVMNGGITVSF